MLSQPSVPWFWNQTPAGHASAPSLCAVCNVRKAMCDAAAFLANSSPGACAEHNIHPGIGWWRYYLGLGLAILMAFGVCSEELRTYLCSVGSVL
jgi:hypothetical protein